jgi:hypothetical protein
MNAIPEKWYVLYKDREEFDIICKQCDKDWTYCKGVNLYGYTNVEINNNWVNLHDDTDGATKEIINENNITQISFEDFTKYIINKEPFISKKQDLNYLKLLLKKLKIK